MIFRNGPILLGPIFEICRKWTNIFGPIFILVQIGWTNIFENIGPKIGILTKILPMGEGRRS